MSGVSVMRLLIRMMANRFTQSSNGFDHGLDVDGRGEMVVEPGQRGTRPGLPVAQGGGCDEKKWTRSRSCLEMSGQFQPIHRRHHEIEQANVRFELGGGNESG